MKSNGMMADKKAQDPPCSTYQCKGRQGRSRPDRIGLEGRNSRGKETVWADSQKHTFACERRGCAVGAQPRVLTEIHITSCLKISYGTRACRQCHSDQTRNNRTQNGPGGDAGRRAEVEWLAVAVTVPAIREPASTLDRAPRVARGEEPVAPFEQGDQFRCGLPGGGPMRPRRAAAASRMNGSRPERSHQGSAPLTSLRGRALRA